MFHILPLNSLPPGEGEMYFFYEAVKERCLRKKLDLGLITLGRKDSARWKMDDNKPYSSGNLKRWRAPYRFRIF